MEILTLISALILSPSISIAVSYYFNSGKRVKLLNFSKHFLNITVDLSDINITKYDINNVSNVYFDILSRNKEELIFNSKADFNNEVAKFLLYMDKLNLTTEDDILMYSFAELIQSAYTINNTKEYGIVIVLLKSFMIQLINVVLKEEELCSKQN